MASCRHGITIVVGLVVFLLLVLAGVSAIITTEHWDGSFAQAEYQIAFQDADGHPLPGVELRVEDEKGNQCFGYPVTDYVHSKALRSDKHGVITFHHVSLGLEFGGRCTRLYWLFPIGNCESPRYVCRFLSGNQEVMHTRFDNLSKECGASHEQVVRKWDWALCRVVNQNAPAEQEREQIGPVMSGQDSDGAPLTVEERAARNTKVDIHAKRETLKEKTGNTHEPLTFTLCKVEKRVEQSFDGKDSRK